MSYDPILELLCERHPILSSLKNSVSKAAEMIIECYSKGGKILVCGNGGSSSDSDHIVGELMKSFEISRPLKKDIIERLMEISGERGKYLGQKLESGLPAISLSSQTSLTTAISNDIDANLIFAQQIIGYGSNIDVLLALSSSGNSQNVIDACITAKALSIKVIGLTGLSGGRMKQYCDILLNVPEERTAFIQELHLPVFHTICHLVENHFFGTNKLKA